MVVRMIHWLGRGAIAIAAIALVANCQIMILERPPEEAMPSLKIMPLGDSITDGYNLPGGYRFPLWQALRDRGYPIDFVGSQQNGPATWPEREHEGHSGWKIAQIHQRLTGWLATTQPDIILLLIGTNDIAQGDRLTAAPRSPDNLTSHDPQPTAPGSGFGCVDSAHC
ncbi:MAG: hypothetical protein HC838_06605 [Spirulinaceae cyanobacterium RM2_2_10]|nr:hypothetical protein [Spirulinaceae cyanobacterium RM2_2_10]